MSVKWLAGVAQNAFVYAVALFYAVPAVLNILWGIAKSPRRALSKKDRSEVPAALISDEWEHREIVVNSVNIHYVICGEGPPMLFVHGFPEFWYSWREQLREFRKDHTCIAVDLRGYGDSDKPTPVTAYRAYEMVEDMAALVRHLNMGPVVSVSHDWGGAIMWNCVSLHPDLFSHNIVCNMPHPRCMARELKSSWRQFKASWYIFLFQLPYLPEFALSLYDYGSLKGTFRFGNGKAMDPEEVELYRYALSRPGALTAAINYYRNLLYVDPRLKVEGKIQTPTLLIWGTGDVALTKATTQGTGKYVEDLEIKELEGVSHWVQQEAAEDVNRLIREYLESH